MFVKIYFIKKPTIRSVHMTQLEFDFEQAEELYQVVDKVLTDDVIVTALDDTDLTPLYKLRTKLARALPCDKHTNSNSPEQQDITQNKISMVLLFETTKEELSTLDNMIDVAKRQTKDSKEIKLLCKLSNNINDLLSKTYINGLSDAVSSGSPPFVKEQLAHCERLTEELVSKGYVADDY